MNNILLASLPELAKMLQTLTTLNSTLSVVEPSCSESTRTIALGMVNQCLVELNSIKAVINLPRSCKDCGGQCSPPSCEASISLPSDTLHVCKGTCEDCDC